MNYLLSYGLQNYTNYKYMNMPNLYNFLIYIFDDIEDEKTVVKYVNTIKTQCGLSFYGDFMAYVRRKLPNHKLLKL